jgi:hypothetical protein
LAAGRLFVHDLDEVDQPVTIDHQPVEQQPAEPESPAASDGVSLDKYEPDPKIIRLQPHER